jgi:hypothetical protein
MRKIQLVPAAVATALCLAHFSASAQLLDAGATAQGSMTGLKWLAGLGAIGFLAWRRKS